MKRRISFFWVALVLAVFAMPLWAQYQVGVIGGVNLANIHSNELEDDLGIDLQNRTLFGAGALFDAGLSEHFALRFEPMFLRKGAEAKATEEGVETISRIKMDYLELPLMARFAFGSNMSNAKPFLLAGPSVGFLLSAKSKDESAGITDEKDIKDELKNLDFGLNFGGGLNVKAGRTNLFIEGRYNLGLANVDDSADDNGVDVRMKNRGLELFAGIALPIGK